MTIPAAKGACLLVVVSVVSSVVVISALLSLRGIAHRGVHFVVLGI
jgi:hypothetical protein